MCEWKPLDCFSPNPQRWFSNYTSNDIIRFLACRSHIHPICIRHAQPHFFITPHATRHKHRNIPILKCGAPSEASSQDPPLEDAWNKVGSLCSSLADKFPLWTIGAIILAVVQPSALSWFKKDMVTTALAVTMLCTGFTLSLEDFKAVGENPKALFAGVLLQYTVMPFLGFSISRLFGASAGIAAGVILVSCCPGGVASNIVCYIAKADVALSVAMTSVSTFLAIIVTPLLTKLLMGKIVPVNGWALFQSTLQVILLPIILGIVLRRSFPRVVDKISLISPLIAVIAVALINGSIVSQNVAAIAQSGFTILSCMSLLHWGGFLMGYGLARVLGFSERIARTTSIEVGMQNSGLGSVLAMQHFADPATAASCVVSACYHSLAGSLLAAWWHSQDNKQAVSSQAG